MMRKPTIWDSNFIGPTRNYSKRAKEYYTQLRPGARSGRGLLDKIDNPSGRGLFDNFHLLQNAVKDQLGYDIQLMDTVRTAEEQQENFRKGRTDPGKIVTYKSGLPGDESEHQKFNALDINFLDPYTDDGSDPRFAEVAKIAKQMGAEWGGDWGKDEDGKIIGFNDRQHFQW